MQHDLQSSDLTKQDRKKQKTKILISVSEARKAIGTEQGQIGRCEEAGLDDAGRRNRRGEIHTAGEGDLLGLETEIAGKAALPE